MTRIRTRIFVAAIGLAIAPVVSATPQTPRGWPANGEDDSGRTSRQRQADRNHRRAVGISGLKVLLRSLHRDPRTGEVE